MGLEAPSELSVHAATDFDGWRAQRRTGAEFTMVIVEQILADQRELQVFARLPARTDVQRNIRADRVRGARHAVRIETGQAIHEAAEGVELHAAGEVPR